jgi:hypothetical protein
VSLSGRAQPPCKGAQNKLFAVFVTFISSVPGAQRLQIPFVANRVICEIRERPSNMYSLYALVTAQILVVLPRNVSGGMLHFLCWYWTMGYPTESPLCTPYLHGFNVVLLHHHWKGRSGCRSDVGDRRAFFHLIVLTRVDLVGPSFNFRFVLRWS